MTWNNYKRQYKLRHQPLTCAVCGKFNTVDFHHIVPTSVNPDLAQVDSNIVILCRLHHFIVGHNSNWTQYNPDVLRDIERLKPFHNSKK